MRFSASWRDGVAPADLVKQLRICGPLTTKGWQR